MTLAEVMVANPKLSIAIVSVLVTLVATLAHKYLTDQDHMKNLKKRQKEIQKELKGCKDQNVLKGLNSELLKLTGVMMKSSFKPMFVTVIPFLVLFWWLKGIYVPVMGNGWIWWYIGFSVVASIILRKVLKVA